MRITQEADYALRIVYLLAQRGKLTDSGTISTTVGVTDRFTVKILRKLVQGGLVTSQKGAAGGYQLALQPREISMRNVLETIDGPMCISRCLEDGYECTRTGDQKHCCTFHCIFGKINKNLIEALDKVTLDQVIGEDDDIETILKKF